MVLYYLSHDFHFSANIGQDPQGISPRVGNIYHASDSMIIRDNIRDMAIMVGSDKRESVFDRTEVLFRVMDADYKVY